MSLCQRFKNRVVVVTGGATGIGKACCLRFASEGANIAIFDIATKEAKITALECENFGVSCVSIFCDVAKEQDVISAFTEILNLWGQIDILVASAGIYSGNSLTEVTLSDWQKVIDINLSGVFLCNKLFAKTIINQKTGGSIINISSMAGKTSWPATAQYSASKTGVIGLSRSVAMELAPFGVNVNVVCPGNTKTKMVESVANIIGARDGINAEEWLKIRANDCPMKRIAMPEEIAGVVAFLASNDAKYITGQAIEVDGGMIMS